MVSISKQRAAKSLNKFNTIKLFYDEFPYKILVRNRLSYIFREKNLSNAKTELDALQQKYERGEPLVRSSFRREEIIDHDTFIEAKNLYIEFCKQKDFKLRVEAPNMQIYSHDYNWLTLLSNKIKSTIEFWEPLDATVQSLEKNVILINAPSEYEYKVTLNLGVDPALANWIRSNPGKAQAGKVCLDTIENNGYTKGYYFYVRDSKVLQLLNLFIGKVQRIDKLVYTSNIDK